MHRSGESPRRRSHRRVLQASVVLMLVVAACGSDKKTANNTSAATTTAGSTATTTGGTTGGSTATTTGATTPGSFPAVIKNGQGVTDTEIKVGIVMDDSGPFAAFSPAIRAALNAEFSFVNDGGGIAGRKVKPIIYDSKSDPAQTLVLTKKLWEQDKVAMIYNGDLAGPPLDYVTQNKIPELTGCCGMAVFSSKYPTIAVTGGATTAWNAQSAYAVVHYQHKSPKHIAVSIFSFEEPLKFWIEDVWKKLGAETVQIDIGVDPTADCSALVLKNKAAGVDFWDFHDNSWLACIPAELNAGWSPADGQGGPATSEIATASLIGKPMADLQVLAGAPTTLANGQPVFDTTPQANLDYINSMKKYAPDFSAERWLNDPVQVPTWIVASLITDALKGAAMTGEISPAAIVNWLQTTKNWPAPLSDPVRNLAGSCKSGTDSTIWGTWQWDDAKKELFMKPFAPLHGEKLINNDWYDSDPCYITKLADKYYVK